MTASSPQHNATIQSIKPVVLTCLSCSHICLGYERKIVVYSFQNVSQGSSSILQALHEHTETLLWEIRRDEIKAR